MTEPRDLKDVVAEFRAAGGIVETYVDPKTESRVLRITVGPAPSALAIELSNRFREATVRIKPKELANLRSGYHDWDMPAVPFTEAVAALATSNEGAPDAD